MAKARIIYVVDDKELVALRKKLKALGPEADKSLKEWEKGLDEVDKKQKKTSKGLTDLKGAIASLGIAGLLVVGIKAFADLNREINKSRKEVALLTSETGAALDNITAKLRATSQVFDKDFNEVLRASNTASKQFGITMTESLDEINEGFARGLDINGDYLDTIREYTPFMEKAGISFRQFNALIQKQVTEGVFSDKGIDSIKEAQISLEEMTPAAQDALKAIGISADQVTKDIQSGARTYFEVIQEIGIKTREALDPRVTGQIKADIFRGAGEDAGDFSLTLDEVGESFVDVTEEQQKYIDNQKLLLKSSEDLQTELLNLTKNTASLATSWDIFVNKAGTAGLRVLNALASGLSLTGAATSRFNDKIKDFTVEEQVTELQKLEKELSDFQKSIEEDEGLLSGFRADAALKNINKLIPQIEILKQKDKERTDAEAQALADKESAQKLVNDALALEKKARQDIIDAQKEEVRLAEEKVKAQKDASIEGLKGLGDIEGKGVDPLDLQSKIGDRTKEIEQKLQDDLLTIREDARQKDIEAQELKAQIDTEARELRNEETIAFIFQSAEQIASINAQFSNRRIEQINLELNALELARNRELEVVEGNAQAEAQINAKFDAQKGALLKKQLNEEKAQQLFSIAINTAAAIVKGIAQFGPPPSPLGIAAIISASAIGLAQTGLVLSQKVPELAEGVLRFQGKGSTTSDSNLVKISDKETILSARTTDDYYPAVKAIYNREIAPEILNNLVMNQDTRPSTIVYDYEKLVKAVMNQPQKNITVDEDGFTGHLISKSLYIQKKQSKMKM